MVTARFQLFLCYKSNSCMYHVCQHFFDKEQSIWAFTNKLPLTSKQQELMLRQQNFPYAVYLGNGKGEIRHLNLIKMQLLARDLF